MIKKLIQKVCKKFRLTLYHGVERVNYDDGFTAIVHHYLLIDNVGVWFSWKGDEYAYIWKAYNGMHWWSTGFYDYFAKFGDIDKMWKEYMRCGLRDYYQDV